MNLKWKLTVVKLRKECENFDEYEREGQEKEAVQGSVYDD